MPEAPIERDQRMRELAYALWERDGRPDGRSDQYWLQACALEADREAANSVGAMPAAGTTPDERRAAAVGPSTSKAIAAEAKAPNRRNDAAKPARPAKPSDKVKAPKRSGR